VEIGIPLESLAAAVQATTGAAMTPGELALLESGQSPIGLNEARALAAVLDTGGGLGHDHIVV
jgi:hypothetical protein